LNPVTDSIDQQIAERRLLLHPFYQRWSAGTLSREALADYAKQYYHHVAAFPRYLSAVHANTTDMETRRQILANLVDEEAGNPNHPELWLRFAEGVGAKREEAQRAEPWEETGRLVDAFHSTCRDGSTAEGLAALYAYESQIPEVAEAKIAGLKKFYRVNNPRTLAYFEVHVRADQEHSAVERKLLNRYVNETNAPAVRKAVGKVLDALWEMLSAVERHYPSAA
jgi:pyrroloquinoline-quinone synthase